MNLIISPPHEKSNFISHSMLGLLNSNEIGELEPEKVILDRFLNFFHKCIFGDENKASEK